VLCQLTDTHQNHISAVAANSCWLGLIAPHNNVVLDRHWHECSLVHDSANAALDVWTDIWEGVSLSQEHQCVLKAR